MTTQELTGLILITESVLYLLLCFASLRRISPGKGDVRALILYTAVSCLWSVEQLAWHMGWLDDLGTNVFVSVRVASYGLVLLALLFLLLTRVFLRLPGTGWPQIGLALAWIAALILLDSNALVLPNLLELPGGWSLGRVALTFGLTIAGWAWLQVAALALTLRTIRRSQSPLHRNRMTYWLVAWAFTVAGDLLFFAGYEVIGGDVHLLGAVVAAYVVLTHRLPDVRATARRAMSYVIITLLTVAIYTAGFTAVQYFFQDVPGYTKRTLNFPIRSRSFPLT